MENTPSICRFENHPTAAGGGSSSSITHTHAGQEHGHTHELMTSPGRFPDRDEPMDGRNWRERAFTVGIGGYFIQSMIINKGKKSPVGSGKTALMLQLCLGLRDRYNIACVTNDIFTREDTEFLVRNSALDPARIIPIETGGCPHAAIREDISANLMALEGLQAKFNTEILLVESGGDNLAANFSRELADYIIYVIDVAGGDKIPRKGGPGITQSDLLIINKTDLAQAVGADLDVMRRDAENIREQGPLIFTQIKFGVGVDEVIEHILRAWKNTLVVS